MPAHPKRFSAERRSPRLLQQQTESAMSSSSKPAYPATCQSHEEMQILALRSKDPLPLPEFVEFVGECEEDISVLALVCCHLVACGRGCEGDIPLLCKHVESIESERALSSKDAIA